MGVLYKFSPEAYWHRATSGTSRPLVTPIFKKMKTIPAEQMKDLMIPGLKKEYRTGCNILTESEASVLTDGNM